MSANLLSLLDSNAEALLLGALLLALGFRRNRFALILVSLAMPIFFVVNAHSGVMLALAMVIASVVILPEPPISSIRAALILVLTLLMPWLPDIVPGMHEVLAGWAQLKTPLAALGTSAWVVILAMTWLLLRWVHRSLPLDLYLLLALSPAIIAFSSTPPQSARAWLAATAAAIALAVLYGAFRMAFIDALTGLPNRRALDERLARSQGRIAIAMVDVDHFKRFNDRYGHESGDRVLRAVARQLRRCRGGAAYRYGGEEFAIVFEGRQIDQATESLENLRAAIETQRVRLGKAAPKKRAQAVRKGQQEGDVGVTVSIGLAQRDPAHWTPTAVVDAADKALYRSKQRGRNRLTLATASRSA